MKIGVEKKKVDPEGRVLLPKDWRRDVLRGTRNVLLFKHQDYLKLIPRRPADITRFIDKFEVELKSSFDDWHRVKAELLMKKFGGE